MSDVTTIADIRKKHAPLAVTYLVLRRDISEWGVGAKICASYSNETQAAVEAMEMKRTNPQAEFGVFALHSEAHQPTSPIVMVKAG